eukprot:983120-Rhodomonas_salina.2
MSAPTLAIAIAENTAFVSKDVNERHHETKSRASSRARRVRATVSEDVACGLDAAGCGIVSWFRECIAMRFTVPCNCPQYK